MKREFFLRALSEIDDDLLIEADVENKENKANAKNKARMLPFRIAGTAAACLILLVGVWSVFQGGMKKAMLDSAAPEAEFAPDRMPTEDAILGAADADGGHDYNYKADEEFSAATAGQPQNVKNAVNEYLAESDSAVRCTGVTEEKTNHARIACVTLTDDPGEDVLSALLEMVKNSVGADSVRFLLPDGTEIETIDA